MAQKKFIGIDVGGTNIKAALVKNGRILAHLRTPTHAEGGFKSSFDQIRSTIAAYIDQAAGIGIGIAGLIDSRTGVVRFSPNLPGWDNIQLASMLRNEFMKPVKILNDVNAFCLGEWQYGAGKGYNNVFLLTLGTGVGGAAVVEGVPLFGANGFAGELGHSVIHENGPKCPCGNRGCLERYVGARHIVALAQKKMKGTRSSLRKHRELSPRLIAQEAKKGDKTAVAVFEEIGYYVGVGITNVIVLFDPDVIIISGGVAKAGKVLIEPIKKTVAQRVMGAEFRKFKIISPKLGDDAGVLGAVYYASQTK